MQVQEKLINFLQGGGQMAERIQCFDWTTTSLGAVEQWPQSLKTSLSIALSSTVPSLLLWGPAYIQLYNDAFDKIIQGSGEISAALGVSAPGYWGQIWDRMQVHVDEVYETGKGCWGEDKHVPSVRNGQLHDIYWNYGYSAVRGESGDIEGVLVIVQDTTQKVLSVAGLAMSEQRFKAFITEATVATAILTGPDMVVELANDAMLQIWDRDRDIIGKPILDVMPELKDQPFPKILADVLATGEPYLAEEALVYLNKKGNLQRLFMDFSYKVFPDEKGKPNSIVVMANDITERVVSKKRLIQSEANLRNTILKAPVAMCILIGEDHVVEIANDRMTELWGKTAEDVMEKPLFHGLPEARNQGFEEMLRRVYSAGETVSAQGAAVDLPRNGGLETVYVNFVYEPYRGIEGTIKGVMVVAVEVTEQVVVHKKIQQSEERVRSIVESAPFPIGVYVGREMRIELANQSILDVWGKGTGVIGKLYSEILPELENQLIFSQLDQVYTTGIPFHAKNTRVDLVVDGSLQTFYFNYSFTPLFDGEGNVYGVMNTAADVTDLNVAKQKVEQSERNFRSMVLQAPVAMCIMMGPEHTIEVANDSMIELWGKSKEDILYKPVFEALPDAKEQGLESLIANVYNTGETFSASEMPVVLVRNGRQETVYLNFVYMAYRDLDGRILGVLAISIDVSPQVIARRQIEEVVAERTKDLAAANINLQRSNAELEQFAYIASHDLQEPLRKVSTFSQLLERSLGEIDERSKNYLDKVNNSTSRMMALVRDVLAYSQLSKEDLVFEPVDLQKTVQGIVNDFELLIEEKNAKILFNNLPVLDAIPLQMSQLFGNLISNALKFSKEKPVISITAERIPCRTGRAESYSPGSGDYYRIVVQDNGIGFSQEYAHKIFNIFQRLHKKTEYSGTGIGLALCKKIAQNHQGEISASSELGKGANFTIFLPLKQHTE